MESQAFTVIQPAILLWNWLRVSFSVSFPSSSRESPLQRIRTHLQQHLESGPASHPAYRYGFGFIVPTGICTQFAFAQSREQSSAQAEGYGRCQHVGQNTLANDTLEECMRSTMQPG